MLSLLLLAASEAAAVVEHGAEAAEHAAHASHAAHAGPPVSPEALTVGHLFGIPITNSMVVGGIIILFIFIVLRSVAANLKQVPTGMQNVVEFAVEGLEKLTSDFLEPKVVRWCFPLIATYFIFILLSNFSGLLPFVGSFGWGESHNNSFFLEHVETPLFRPPTADANMTVAMALIFFVMSTYWAIKYNGFVGLIKHIFGVKGGISGWLFFPMSLVFIFVGLIEVIALLVRPVALSMRLYGNVYGGENVITIMLKMLPHGLGFITAIPFYFLEMIVATVQALVFTLLCIAFISTLCSHTDDGHGHGHDDKEGHAKH